MRQRLRLDPVGRHHDLGRIFDRLNERYFRSRITAAITRDAVEELGLAEGVAAVATVKSTSVMVERA